MVYYLRTQGALPPAKKAGLCRLSSFLLFPLVIIACALLTAACGNPAGGDGRRLNSSKAITGLMSVSLPVAATIGEWAFRDTGTKSLSVTPGSTVPTLGYRMFYDVESAKTVTVQVPDGVSDRDALINGSPYSESNTDANRGNGFRGGGWTGSAFQSDGAGYVNSNISLTITTLP